MQNSTRVPEWLDKKEYPFESHYFETENGKIHYIDEGIGDVILFVHGTPSWSFLYRNYIKELSKTHRCIALDHLGFGLSDKPENFSGTPEAHSANLESFVTALRIEKCTLVVHDFGGPIGLSFAINYPEKVTKIILFNTWLWGTKENKAVHKINKVLTSRIGKFIYLNTNFSPKFLFKKGFHNPKLLSKRIHKHYQHPFTNKSDRHGLLNIGKSILGSSDWYQKHWDQLERIKEKPFLVLWGTKDQFITEEYLQKWNGTLENATIHKFVAGHFVQEEQFEKSMVKVKEWL